MNLIELGDGLGKTGLWLGQLGWWSECLFIGMGAMEKVPGVWRECREQHNAHLLADHDQSTFLGGRGTLPCSGISVWALLTGRRSDMVIQEVCYWVQIPAHELKSR